ncbi:MAG: hypothetical protein V3W44_02125 [Dehalococcoidales bacterium]
MTDIIKMLDELAELRAQADVRELDRQEAINAVMPEDVREKITAIKAAFDLEIAAITDAANGVEKLVKGAVLSNGESVRGAHLHAIFSKRTSWDTKALSGYAAAHPEILTLRKQSESVSIRRRK